MSFLIANEMFTFRCTTKSFDFGCANFRIGETVCFFIIPFFVCSHIPHGQFIEFFSNSLPRYLCSSCKFSPVRFGRPTCVSMMCDSMIFENEEHPLNYVLHKNNSSPKSFRQFYFFCMKIIFNFHFNT